MRLKIPAFLLSTLLTINVSAAAEDPGVRARGPLAREGRAVILHPAGPLTHEDRADLERKGVHVKHALTGGRYLARVAEGVEVEDPRVERLEPLTAAHRIHRSAYRAVANGHTAFRAHVIFQRDVDFDAAREAILAAGGALDPLKVSFSPSHRIDATISPSALAALAADDRIFAVGAARNWKVRSHNADTAAISHVTELHQAPYDLTGEGVTISLFELSRGQIDHIEFTGRNHSDATGGGSGDAQHATHVAGTMIAAGINPDAKGMAPAAQLYQFCVSTPCGGSDQTYLDEKDEVLPSLGVTADNNSWGYVLGWSSEDGFPVWNDAEEYFGAYELFTSMPIDEMTLERGILFVHSAGNEGFQSFSDESSAHRHVDDQGDTITDKLFCYSRNGSGTDCGTGCTGGCEILRHLPSQPFDTIGVTAAAKNIITVGNLRAESVDNMFISTSSSRGPAKDGRIKPDVVARGSNVLSSIPTNRYGALSGTSMASPAVTGIAALLTEQWRRTFAGGDPTPAQLKALILAGADDLGNPGPDYSYGFGLVNAKSSVDIIRADGGQSSRIRNLTLAQGQTIEISTVVSEPQNFRALLQWPDPATPFFSADGIAHKALVNDLDIRVIDPSGVEHHAWVLDKDNPDADATRGVNTVDNTELVEIANAVPGIYRIVINGTAVAEGPQTAVLVSSSRAAAPCRDLQEPVAGSNDTVETAYDGLVPRQLVNAGLCAAGDVDYYSIDVTRAGNVSVTVTAKDTPLRVTLVGGPINATREIAANSTATLTANAPAAPLTVLLRVEAAGAIGPEPQYSFVPVFEQTNQPRRRATGR